MASVPALKPVVLRCRERLRQGREKIRRQHDGGSPGTQVSILLADLYDDIVLDVWAEATSEFESDSRLSGVVLVAHGGFGRRDLSPYSDADLMLLTTRRSAGLAAQLAGVLTRDLVDVGFQVGFAIRTPAEACSLAWRDPVIFSSLTESRLLAGGLHVYAKYFESLRKGAKRRCRWLLGPLVEARREERRKWGETNYLLRPNVKRSRGALRDIQLIRWVGFARFGESDLERLVKLDALPEEDFRRLRRAYSFMLRLRHELHFRSGRGQDVLDRPTQLEIAEAWGYLGREGVLPVEAFMQDYFEHTRNVRYASAFFTDDNRSRSFTGRLIEVALSRRIDDQIRMGPTHIWVRESELEAFANSLTDVLRLMHLANHHRRRISHPTWHAIRQAMQEREPSRPSPAAISYFLGLMSRPGRLASLLNRLHELRVLEQLIPAMKRCRGLLQFNAYHKYTVDAHCIRAVQEATNLEESTTPMGRRYRRLRDKTLLHLALLLHDLGKGYDEDHCEVGRRIAKETAERLDLDPASSETLQWLIHKHLVVNVFAFRHNLTDPEVVLGFAADVASVRRLELLIVHAVADLAAVGPGVATEWKMHLIEELYRRARRYFETGNLPGESDEEVEGLQGAIREALDKRGAPKSTYELLDSLPLSLLRRNNPEDLSEELFQTAEWLAHGGRSRCTGRYDPSVAAMRYTVLHHEGSRRIGTFARATGALSGCGLTIMRANIESVGEDLAWDDFWVIDPDYPGEPPSRRSDEVCEQITRLLENPELPLPSQRRTWPSPRIREPDAVNLLPTKVTFDNETLDRYTIVSLFAYDRVGLLYRVAQALAEARVVLHFAKIDTHLDQIADVFYVTEQDGSTIRDPQRQQDLRRAMLEAVA